MTFLYMHARFLVRMYSPYVFPSYMHPLTPTPSYIQRQPSSSSSHNHSRHNQSRHSVTIGGKGNGAALPPPQASPFLNQPGM